ncbi:MAG: hypothetical protein NVS4B9_21100 [Ktedonobacteraceae bacterium]
MATPGEQRPGEGSTYYNLPLVKKAHWGWEIILYFFLGGIAGGSYLVATLANFFGLERDKPLVRAGRYLSFVCILASPILLIMDLGRPERFHHMLRVLKFRSAMSLGTWGLSSFGLFCGLTAAHQMAKDGLLNWFPPIARLMKALPVKVIEPLGAFFGLFVASYTGVLLSSTAVPIWGRAKHLLGPLFLTSGLSTGLSALSLILSFGRSKGQQDTLERLDQAEMIAEATELGLIGALIPTLGPLAKPLFQGKTGTLFTMGTIGGGLLLPLLLKLGWRVSRKPTSRSLTVSTSLLVLIGGMILRTAWIVVGRTSADNPQDTHYYNSVEWNERKS